MIQLCELPDERNSVYTNEMPAEYPSVGVGIFEHREFLERNGGTRTGDKISLYGFT